MHLIRIAGALLAAAGLAAAAADAPRLEPGNYRLRVTSITNGVADPDQDTETCLTQHELKDLAAYFSPVLEGVKASCSTTRVPGKDAKVIARRLRCTGNGFTYNAESTVTIVNSSRFSLAMSSLAKTPTETGIVSAKGEGDRLGPCKKP